MIIDSFHGCLFSCGRGVSKMAANERHGSRGIEVVTDEMLHEVNKIYFGHESFRREQANICRWGWSWQRWPSARKLTNTRWGGCYIMGFLVLWKTWCKRWGEPVEMKREVCAKSCIRRRIRRKLKGPRAPIKDNVCKAWWTFVPASTSADFGKCALISPTMRARSGCVRRVKCAMFATKR